jgi:hypothetical protein
MRIASIALVAAGLLLAACGPDKAQQISKATESAARLQEGVVEHATNRGGWPKHIDDLKVGGDPLPGVSYAVGEGGVVAVYFAEGSGLPGAQLVYTPTQDAQGNVTWTCASQGVDAELKPAGCA